MNRLLLICLVLLSLPIGSLAQKSDKKIYTSDIDNFWVAYDSVLSTKDTVQQTHFMQTLYIDKGTEGLKDFMEARDYSAELWVKLINQSPKFWNSVRPNTLTVKSKSKDIEKSIQRLKKLYPELKEAKMFFTVGGLRSGGTVKDNKVLIGTEIATGTAETNLTDLPKSISKWLTGVFQDQRLDNIIPLNIHEFIHTQQNGDAHNLLGQAIGEGSCDFITELVLGKPLQNNYIQYGRVHEPELKEKFKIEMFSNATRNWLYNGSNTDDMADLGYFIGYAICKSYYENAPNKKQAIKEIIQLNYSDSTAVESFLSKSKYYREPIAKEELLKKFEEQRPTVARLEPFANGDSLVDSSVREVKIVFSTPMKTGYSINIGASGKEHFPITEATGYSEDKSTFTVRVDLKPETEYEFILSDRSFSSTQGFPLKPCVVRFKTK